MPGFLLSLLINPTACDKLSKIDPASEERAPMTQTDDFATLRQQASLTLEEAANLLSVSTRTIRRYDNGESGPNQLAWRVLREEVSKRSGDSSQSMPDFTFVDLFAGIGGLR